MRNSAAPAVVAFSTFVQRRTMPRLLRKAKADRRRSSDCRRIAALAARGLQFDARIEDI